MLLATCPSTREYFRVLLRRGTAKLERRRGSRKSIFHPLSARPATARACPAPARRDPQLTRKRNGRARVGLSARASNRTVRALRAPAWQPSYAAVKNPRAPTIKVRSSRFEGPTGVVRRTVKAGFSFFLLPVVFGYGKRGASDTHGAERRPYAHPAASVQVGASCNCKRPLHAAHHDGDGSGFVWFNRHTAAWPGVFQSA
jgi:hypothetical protein